MANDNGSGSKEINEEALDKTVRTLPEAREGQPPGYDTGLIWFVANAADEFTPFGTPGSVKMRDRQLRIFAPTENTFLSGIGVVASRNSGFSWKVDGPPRISNRYKEVLEYSDDGRGWGSLITKTTVDLSTQDNGAFWEWVREEDKPESPVIAINHLDSYRCWHTGDPLHPVIYQDMKGRYHLMNWWSVHEFAEMPAPIEGLPGIQFSTLTRLLRACQIIKNIAIYKEEKTGGRHVRAIHLIKGLTQTQIEDALKKYQARADSQGVLRYVNPLIVGSVDPKADVGHDTLELASLPDGFNEKETFDLYIAQIAMAFLSDYQEFAPLPGGGLGTSAQSQVLHLKTRGKGPAVFQNMITYAINLNMLPKGVEFTFDEQDPEADKAIADVRKIRADTRAVMVTSGELTVEASRQMAVDEGDIPQEIYDEYLQMEDITEDVTLESGENKTGEAEPKSDVTITSGAPPNAPTTEKLGGVPAAGAKDDDLLIGEKHPGGPGHVQKRHAGGYPNGDPRNEDHELAAEHDKVTKLIGVVPNAEKGIKGSGFSKDPGDSMSIHRDPTTGEWTPERQKLHREILAEYEAEFAHIPRDGKAVIMGGLPGAGKSTAIRNGSAKIYDKDYVPLAPDDIKERLIKKGAVPSQQYKGLRDGEYSPLLHEEASYITKEIAKMAYTKRQNVLWDITMSTPAQIMTRQKSLFDHGYTNINHTFVDAPMSKALNQAAGRWKNSGPGGPGTYTGRFMSLDIIQAASSKTSNSSYRDTFDFLREAGKGNSKMEFHLIDSASDEPKMVY